MMKNLLQHLLSGCLLLLIMLPGQGRAQDLALSSSPESYVPLNWYEYEDKESDFRQEISITLDDVRFEEALIHIADESNLRLTYDYEQLPDSRVSLSVENSSVIDTFRKLLSGSGLEAMASPRGQIVIRKTQQIQADQPDPITVTGVVTDAGTGETLPGVNVVLDGSTTGTSTDLDGEYSLEVDDPETVLVFSYVGYATQRITVGDQEEINVSLQQDLGRLDEVIVVGYGTVQRSDMTGSVERVTADQFQNQPMTQLSDMLTGTIAGFSANQSTGPAGGSSLEVRGPNSLTAGTEPMIVVDGAIFHGSMRDINPADVETIDILKDASSAAVYGANAASGVVLITTNRGQLGKPVINYSTQLGVTQPTRERRPLGPDEYIQFRTDWFRTVFPDQDYHYYTHPDELPADMTQDEWRDLSESPLADNTREYLRRLAFFPIEQENYINGRTIDWYDQVMQNGIRQNHDINVSGGTEDATYFFSMGYVNNEGLRVGDDYSAIRSRLNVDYQIVDWLNVGLNAQFSDRDESGVPASMGFFTNSPYGQMYDAEGNLERLPHGHTFNPLIDHHRDTRDRRINSLFGNLYADLTLPFGIEYRLSFQPRYQNLRDFRFRTTDVRVGGDPNQDQSTASRARTTDYDYTLDNIISWNRQFGIHDFDVTLLYSVEESRRWSETMSNQNFLPGEQLGFHGIHFGDNPSISSSDRRVTGDGMMARLNYSLMSRYLFTASVRRDGYSAFGQSQPRATFPAFAFAWQLGDEPFFNVDWVNQLKLRLSWGVNGNRNIGVYSALAQLNENLWFDGSSTRVGVYNSSLANRNLRWERTESFNVGVDLDMLDNRVLLTLDAYEATTTDLLMNRRLPTLTGFNNITTNLGELRNRGFEMTVRTRNVTSSSFNWSSTLVFSLNRNEIVSLFGDMGDYRILGEDRTGELPDFTNRWFIGRAIDAVWDYEFLGIWQEDEADEAARYGMRPGDVKAVDVDNNGVFRAEDDKQFIGHTEPRYRLGLRNEVSFLGNWTASVFIRADLGHIGAEPGFQYRGDESNDRRNRNVGPVPYWTPENPNSNYPRLDVITSGYGGGITVYRDRSFVRVQDISLAYDLPSHLADIFQLRNLRIYGSIRNAATFTDWPHWDPESGSSPMPRTFTLGLNLSL